MSDQKYRTMSLIEENFRDNSILTIWTNSMGLIVRPWYENDKLVFNFIEKGKAGKGKTFSVCIPCLKYGAGCFDNWAYDILNDRRFERTLAEEKNEKYPVTYQIVTGDKGSKSLGICNSSSGKGGYCINAKSGSNYANIPVTFHDLRLLATNYKRSYEDRRKYLDGLRREAVVKNNNLHNQNLDAEEYCEAEYTDDSGTNITVFMESASGVKQRAEYPDCYAMKGVDSSGVKRNIVFTKQAIEEMSSLWNAFFKRANDTSKGPTSFNAEYEIVNENGVEVYQFIRFI